MNYRLLLAGLALATLWPAGIRAQEAASGFEVHTTVSVAGFASNELTEDPRNGAPASAGYRAVVYPVWKLDDHWTVNAALQSYSRPYFYETFSTAGYGIKDNVLQANLGYASVTGKGSVLVRAGILSPAFGSFLLHYDDADNALTDMPLEYGYYYQPISTLGVAAVQADATRGKWDGRVQLSNSSPSNPRSVFAHDQYANWTAGGGYTVRQGLRIGVSAYRGPYLSRDYAFYFPGEAPPGTLKARAAGVDVQWARGHWNVAGEWQTFVMPYKAIPTYREQAGYAEAKRVLSPRWYVAARGGYTHASFGGNVQRLETAVGFRPNRLQILKVGYDLQREASTTKSFDNSVTFQFVTSLHLFSLTHK